MKYCIDCKHFEDIDYIGFQCNRAVHREINLVMGEPRETGHLDPELERKGLPPVAWATNVETCGPEGRFWEAK